MQQSPRTRRLNNDYKAMKRLQEQSSILSFSTPGPMFGGPPESYHVQFRGRGVWRQAGSSETLVLERHEVVIHLGASYPRTMPELTWKSPVFHPNVSGSGVVCLGGYGTHWVPSLSLDELCEMLWDMARYANFDVESPYNREAAVWAKQQQQFQFPLDERPIRDKIADEHGAPDDKPPITKPPQDFIIFETDVVDAEVIDEADEMAAAGGPEDQDIVFLD